MLGRAGILALGAVLQVDALAAQQPWPGARCYELARGRWARTDRAGGAERQPDAPDLIVLDSARRGALLGLGDRPDTVGRVAHGVVRDRRAPTPRYSDYGGDRWFSGWTRRTPDSVTVRLGTEHGGLEFDFRVDGDRLIGRVRSWTDYGPGWTAPVIGRRIRCPAGPSALPRLRLSIVEAPGLVTEAYLPMPELDLELSMQGLGTCDGSIDYTLVRQDTLLAVTLQGLVVGRRGERPPARATTRLGAMLGPGRYAVLIGHPTGVDTNRFALRVTDSSAQLATVRSTFVTAEERPQRRPPHNLFEARCGHRAARALCDEFERWLAALPGISRAAGFPARKQLGEDTWVALFHYDSKATLGRVRACVQALAEAVRPTDGVYVTIRTWLGEQMGA
jgi:hypothetical protein